VNSPSEASGGNGLAFCQVLRFGSSRGIATRCVSEDEAAFRRHTRLRFGSLSQASPPEFLKLTRHQEEAMNTVRVPVFWIAVFVVLGWCASEPSERGRASKHEAVPAKTGKTPSPADDVHNVGQVSQPTAAPQDDSSLRQEGERYALLIGVRSYDKASGLRSLAYSENDATRLADVLKVSGYRPENVVVMSDSQADENFRLLPEREKILQLLDSFLRDRSEGDSVLVAFAGHGVHFKGKGDSYFCPLDTRLDREDSLVSIAEVYRRLEACRAGFKLVLYDACRNDPFAPTARGLELLLEDNTRAPRLAPPGGVAAFYSCSEGEVAYEDPDLKQGVFFHFVIRDLQGAADLDKDKEVTLPELEYYVKRRVLDYVRSEFAGNRQMPNLRGNTRGLVSLAKVVTAQPRKSLPEPKKPIISEGSSDAPAEQNLPIKVAYTNSLAMPFVLVPPGEFLMGEVTSYMQARDARPRHRVRISRPFFMGAFEVTQREYDEVMGDNPSYFAMGGQGERSLVTTVKYGGGRLTSTKTDFHPIEQVTWQDAVEFCNCLSKREGRVYRLPTEAEWEYTCRAGTQTRFSWGDDVFIKSEVCFSGSTSGPVGRLKPNLWGLFDAHGNVWEWCSDRYSPSYFELSPSVDPQGPMSNEVLRVLRGGDFKFGTSSVAASKRHYAPENRSAENIGFRIVLELNDAELAQFRSERRSVVDEVPLPAFSALVRSPTANERARQTLALAVEAMHEEDHIKARKLFEEALSQEPALAFALVELPATNPLGQRTTITQSVCRALADTYGRDSPQVKAIDLYSEAYGHREAGRYHEAILSYLQGIEADPKFVWNANNLAWLLATCSETQIRDGQAAVEYAKRACANSCWTSWLLLGTLAAAYAQAGDFETALRLHELSKRNHGDPPPNSWATTFDLQEWQYNLERYRQAKPWADVPESEEPAPSNSGPR
jgi:formylglycine-generating enzyme required for sulfatase activity/tetratricopeptide (TPR) repeat protein